MNLVFLLLGLGISFILAVILVRIGIRTYFREKHEHLRSLLNTDNNLSSSKKEKQNG